jgi:A-kinase anchor protein 13
MALYTANGLVMACFRFEGVSMLMQGRGKMQLVLVIVLSDVLFFLLENNHKYSFFTPDNKVTCDS